MVQESFRGTSLYPGLMSSPGCLHCVYKLRQFLETEVKVSFADPPWAAAVSPVRNHLLEMQLLEPPPQKPWGWAQQPVF